MSRRLIIFCSVLLLLTADYQISSQIEGKEKEIKYSDSSQARFNVVEASIQKEISQQGNHNWAGDYYYGDGLGVNVSISLAPKSGFVFSWSGCLGLYDLNYGKIEESDGKIILLPELANKREGFQGIDTEFYPVLWGERHYLIPTSEMIKFINDINSGYEPVSAGFFGTMHALRRGDKDKKVSGKPHIPVGFEKYLLEKPIDANILQVLDSKLEENKELDSKYLTTNVVLDAGKVNGVLKGMEFYISSPSEVYESAEIIEVGEKTSKAKIVQIIFKDIKTPTPAINWKLSTRHFKK